MLGSSFIAEASPYTLNYAGRLTSDAGVPVEGPINIEVKFFRSEAGIDEVAVTVPEFTNITLSEGVFQLMIDLPLDDFHTVFTATDAVWIQIKDTVHNVIYPRQTFSAVPFALKIPTDNISLGYTSEGKLTLLNATNLQGRSVSNETPGDGNILRWSTAESKWEPGAAGGTGSVTSVGAGAGLETDQGGAITGAGAISIKNSGVISGMLAPAAVTFAKIDATPCSDGQILKRSGGAWACGSDLNSGSVTSVTASSPILSSGGATPDISIPQATSVSSGYLLNTDWILFNGKQTAGNYVTALTGDVTASGPAGGGSAAATITNSAVIGKVLTGFSSGAGVVSASDTILSAVQKLDGNIATKQDSITTLAVNKGGTGQATLTSGAILLGNGTTGITSTGPGTTGQIPISTGATVAMQSMSGDATLASTGALTIANNAVTSAKINVGEIANAHISGTAAISTAKISGAVTSIASHGLGTAATLNVGTGASNIIQLNSSGEMPYGIKRSCDTGNTNDVMIPVGTWCVDKYEASIYSVADGTGAAYFSDGTTADFNYPDATRAPVDFSRDGSFTGANQYYAVSKPGVIPARGLTWYQAMATCMASGKQLIPDSIWQAAAMGTPDPGASSGTGGRNGGSATNSANAKCNTNTHGGSNDVDSDGLWSDADNKIRKTAMAGANRVDTNNCISQWGAEDMVGNLWEWTDMNGQQAGTQSGFSQGMMQSPTMLGKDDGTWNINGSAYGYNGTTYGWANGAPAAALRGGYWDNSTGAGVFALNLYKSGSYSAWDFGFRCARPR